MNSLDLQRIYENAALDASRIDREFPWLRADEVEMDDQGDCRTEFTITAVVAGTNEREMLAELIEALQARSEELERSLRQQSPRSIMAPSAGQRSATARPIPGQAAG